MFWQKVKEGAVQLLIGNLTFKQLESIKETKSHIKTVKTFFMQLRREANEVTGLDVEHTCTTGIYNFISSAGNQVILFHFIGEVSGGSFNLEEDEIIDSKWVKMLDLVDIDNEELRDARRNKTNKK